MAMSLLLFAVCLGVFLAGLRVMRQGLEGMAQGRLPVIIKQLVRTPSRGILTGGVSAALLQSSAAVTAITVGMVAGGTMTFRDAIGVVLGANVGTTVTPQLLTLNLWAVVIPALILGILALVSTQPKFLHPGMAMVGFASIYIALEIMPMALHGFTKAPWFSTLLTSSATYPVLTALAGCLASALVQSSTAVTVLTMALMANHTMSLEAAIAVVLGANVGTCLTAIIASIGQSRAAKQVALAHVVLNVGGAIFILPWLHQFAQLMARSATNPAQQIANAHTVFNVACTLAVWPLTTQFARLIERLLPDDAHA